MIRSPFSFIALLCLATLGFLSSCRTINSNIMLTADKDFPFDTLHTDSATTYTREYKLNGNDIIDFRLFANDGFKLIDIASLSSTSPAGAAIVRQGFEYQLDYDGVTRLPIIGAVSLKGMTIREAELHLEQRYSEYYVKPFAIIRVVNRRVIVFPGEPGAARVIMLTNNNTTLVEALAQAGGISDNGKAHKIRLIRQTSDPGKPKIYKIDLSTMNNIAQGNIVVQSNDIIYVEPRRQLASRALREVTPIISLASSLFTLYVIIARL